jgi:hypothetical protein
MKIDDLIFSKFVGNDLTHKQMEDVEQQLIADGEFSAAIEASVLDYENRQDEANSILGTEENDSSIENNSENVVRNQDFYDSEETKTTSLTTKSSIIMNIDFTKDEVLKIQELSAEFNNAENKDLTLNENLVAFYLAQRPGTAKEDAEKILEALTKGVRTFHEELTEALKNNGVNYVEKLQELGQDLSNEQKYEIYINFLSTLTVLDVQNFDEEKASQIENFQTVKGRYAVSGEVTEEMLDGVIEKIANALKDNTFCLTTTEMMASLFEKIQEGSSLEECLSGSEEDFRMKLANAMMTYIAYQKGLIASLAGQEIAPEAIAVGAAAGVEQARVMEDFRLGRISWDRALEILKFIGGVALWCTLAFLFTSAAVVITLLSFAAMTNFLGGSILAMVISGAVSMCLAFELAELTAETVLSIIEWGGSAFDQVIRYWQETAWPFVKERASEISDWFKTKTEEKTVEVQTESNPQVVVVPQS